MNEEKWYYAKFVAEEILIDELGSLYARWKYHPKKITKAKLNNHINRLMEECRNAELESLEKIYQIASRTILKMNDIEFHNLIEEILEMYPVHIQRKTN